MAKSNKEIAKIVLEKMLRQEYMGGRHMAFLEISKTYRWERQSRCEKPRKTWIYTAEKNWLRSQNFIKPA